MYLICMVRTFFLKAIRHYRVRLKGVCVLVFFSVFIQQCEVCECEANNYHKRSGNASYCFIQLSGGNLIKYKKEIKSRYFFTKYNK